MKDKHSFCGQDDLVLRTKQHYRCKVCGRNWHVKYHFNKEGVETAPPTVTTWMPVSEGVK